MQRASDRFGWGVPVLVCVPYGEDLDKPSVHDLVHLFEGGFSREEQRGTRYDPSRSSSATAARSSTIRSGAYPDEQLRPVLLAGREHLSRRFSHYELITTSLERFMGKLLDLEKSSAWEQAPICFVTHSSRSDVISGLLGHRAIVESIDQYPSFGGGLIIAGSADHRLGSFVEEYIRMAKFLILRSNLRMTQTLAAIKDLTPKMQDE